MVITQQLVQNDSTQCLCSIHFQQRYIQQHSCMLCNCIERICISIHRCKLYRTEMELTIDVCCGFRLFLHNFQAFYLITGTSSPEYNRYWYWHNRCDLYTQLYIICRTGFLSIFLYMIIFQQQSLLSFIVYDSNKQTSVMISHGNFWCITMVSHDFMAPHITGN